MSNFRAALIQAQTLVQNIAMLLFALLAIGLVVSTALALAGVLPWPEMILFWQNEQIVSAGMWAQIALTIFAITLCFFLPANKRMLQLEQSHRRFNVAMDDVARAYVAAHAADRDGAFLLADEFDQMRARLGFLRNHPDLGDLEPELLELAAQMSFESRELAERYSNMRVDRARGFLEQRQQELDKFNERLDHAKAINAEFKLWINRIDLEESVAAAQMERLLEELERVLPELNQSDPPEKTGKVMMLPKRVD